MLLSASGLSCNRQPNVLCSPWPWCLFPLLKGFFMTRSGLSFPGAGTLLFCPSVLPSIEDNSVSFFYSLFYLLCITPIPSSELVGGSRHLFYFTELSFSASLLDCLLSSFPKVSRKDSSFKLFYCIKPSFWITFAFLPPGVIHLVLYNFLSASPFSRETLLPPFST